MKVISVTVPLEIFNIYSADLIEASYCPNTEAMYMPIKCFSALMNHPLTLELVNDANIELDFIVANDD